MSDPSRVTVFDADDPDMRRANERARDTFGDFWREIAWDRRRIVLALDLAIVKAPFSDGPNAKPRKGVPGVEYMWLNGIDFDGRDVSGTLMKSPNWIKSVGANDGRTARKLAGSLGWDRVVALLTPG